MMTDAGVSNLLINGFWRFEKGHKPAKRGRKSARIHRHTLAWRVGIAGALIFFELVSS